MKRRLRAPVRSWVLGPVALLALFAIPPSAWAEVPANGRGWELISPSAPVSAKVSGVIPVEEDDSRLVYLSMGPMPGAVSGSVFMNANLAERGTGGWSGTPVGIPYSLFAPDGLLPLVPIQPVAFSQDRRTSLWLSLVPLTPDSPPEGQTTLYRRAPDGALTMLGKVSDGQASTFEVAVHISKDGQRAIFGSDQHLLPADAGRTAGESAYEWDGADLRLVDVDDGGSLLSSCGSSVSAAGGVSATGNRVFFSNPATFGCPGTRRVYLREGSSTVEVSASQCTRVDCGPPQDVEFAAATPSGGSAYLTTTQQLTNDDVDEGRDLYRYDVEDEALTLITVAQPEASGATSARPVHSSPDGTRVYFHADGRLVTGEGPSFGESLYLADQDGLHFIAPTGSGDRVELARDGRNALFTTAESLEEADTDGRQDVFLYDADAYASTPLSVGPSGGSGPFDANLKAPLEEGGPFEGGDSPSYRSISDDGQDAFFSTKEKLVPEDVNEATDVYEWTGGNLGLVSSGTGTGPASFGGVSPSGRTALFRTTATLTWNDRDGGDGDLYAARIGGGFAPEVEAPPACEGLACASTPRAPLQRADPGSASRRERGRGGQIRLRSIRWQAGPKAAAGAAVGLVATVPSPGRVSAVVSMQGGRGKRVTLARGSGGAIRPGKIRIVLRLTGPGRRALARQGALTGSLAIRAADARLARPLDLVAGVAK